MFFRLALAGLVTGGMSSLVEGPVDLLKVRLQVLLNSLMACTMLAVF